MRRLEAVRLVQWYHFQDQVFPIGANCVLVGDNGSGKTTVLDAIQIALVADDTEALYNRAANVNSSINCLNTGLELSKNVIRRATTL